MSRRAKARIKDLEARDLHRVNRIAELEEALATSEGVRRASTRRESDMAGTIIRLSRQLKATQKQLDDATKTGDVGLLTVRPRPADKGQVTA